MLQALSKVLYTRWCTPLTPIGSDFDKLRLIDVKDSGKQTTHCLAAAHALVRLDDGVVVGDPMEKTTLEALEWQISQGLPFGVALCIHET